jgi:hypothetical protein
MAALSISAPVWVPAPESLAGDGIAETTGAVVGRIVAGAFVVDVVGGFVVGVVGVIVVVVVAGSGAVVGVVLLVVRCTSVVTEWRTAVCDGVLAASSDEWSAVTRTSPHSMTTTAPTPGTPGFPWSRER